MILTLFIYNDAEFLLEIQRFLKTHLSYLWTRYRETITEEGLIGPKRLWWG